MQQVARPPLVIVASRDLYKRIRLAYIFLTPFAVLGIAQAVHDWNRGSQQRDMAYVMIGLALFMMTSPLLLLVARRKWVARIDEHGVTLRNGKQFAWRDYRGFEAVKNHKLRMIDHYELVFATGRAFIAHLHAENADEVMAVVRCFEDGGNPFVPRSVE